MPAPFVNQIVAGDCLEIMDSLPENLISCCITDPPYNYEFVGRNWDHEEINRRISNARGSSSKTLVKNIPYGSGLAGGVRNGRWYERVHENIVEYEQWCASWGEKLFRISKPGATVLVFNSTRTIAHVQVALERAGFYARDILVYRRSSGIPKGFNAEKQLAKRGFPNSKEWEGWHSCLRTEWEAICLVQKPLIGNYLETVEKFGTGLFYTKTESGGFQSNIFENIERDKISFDVHCTVKPLSLMRKLVQVFAPPRPDSVIFDPFAGTGTTLVAAKEAGITFLGIEKEKKYVEVAKDRLREISRKKNGGPSESTVRQETLQFGE